MRIPRAPKGPPKGGQGNYVGVISLWIRAIVDITQLQKENLIVERRISKSRRACHCMVFKVRHLVVFS